MRLTVVAGAVLCVLAACGGGGTKTRTDATVSTASSTSTSVASTPTTSAATTPVSVAPTRPTVHLVAVRVARQDGADRIVFEFAERVPGYKVAYLPKPVIGTSGKETPLAGSAALVVRMEQASGVDLSGGFKQIYQGPSRVAAAGTLQVLEVAQVEDFEGVLTWAAGTKAEAPFRVLSLSAPPRLVIDVSAS
jgi:hypothetical protein